jgi:hypothetical protein
MYETIFKISTTKNNGSLILSRLIGSLLSLMPEKEAKRASRNRNPCDVCHRTCRRKRHAHATPQASRFLNARIAPIAQHPDSEHHLSIGRITSKSSGERGDRIQSKGFNFGASLQCTRSHPFCAPKLLACAAGIESERYDFDRFLLSQRLISLWLRLLFPKGSLWDFLGKKVTSSIGMRWAHPRNSLFPKENETLPK